MPRHSAVKLNTVTDVSISVTVDIFKCIESAQWCLHTAATLTTEPVTGKQSGH